MKRIFIFLFLAGVSFYSCDKSDPVPDPDIDPDENSTAYFKVTYSQTGDLQYFYRTLAYSALGGADSETWLLNDDGEAPQGPLFGDKDLVKDKYTLSTKHKVGQISIGLVINRMPFVPEESTMNVELSVYKNDELIETKLLNLDYNTGANLQLTYKAKE